MAIVGSTPETGVRIDVSRPRDGGPPWRYEGEAVTPAARLPLTARVSADGQVSVEFAGEAPDSSGAFEAIANRVRLLLRAAYKHARDDGQPPPRHIVRWRADGRADDDVAPPRRDE